MRRAARSEDGFTLIELLVGATILVIGIFGIVAAVDASRKLSDVSEHQNVASAVADRELHSLLTVPYNSLALSATPPTTGAANDVLWNSIYNGTNVSPPVPPIVPNPSGGNSCTGTISETLPNNENSTACLVSCPTGSAVNGACPIVPGTIAPYATLTVPTANGSLVRVKVFRYITWVNDVPCGTTCPNLPAGAKGDYKRLTVAAQVVAPDTGGIPGAGPGLGPARPIVVSATRTDPQRAAGNLGGNGSPCTIAPC